MNNLKRNKMKKIPTAEEIMQKNLDPHDCLRPSKCYGMTLDAMIEFARLHVEEALKEALESIPCLGSSTDIATYEEVEEAVLNAYPLENIK
jgi:hypothetical protein